VRARPVVAAVPGRARRRRGRGRRRGAGGGDDGAGRSDSDTLRDRRRCGEVRAVMAGRGATCAAGGQAAVARCRRRARACAGLRTLTRRPTRVWYALQGGVRPTRVCDSPCYRVCFSPCPTRVACATARAIAGRARCVPDPLAPARAEGML
jgi:hypothetical protein